MKITIDSYFKKEKEIEEIKGIIENIKLSAKDSESLKKNKEYKKLNNDLKLKQEQIKIIEGRLGKTNVGQAIMNRTMDKYYPWMKNLGK